MADTITLPSGVEIYEGKVLVLPGSSTILPIGALTPAEVQALRDDVAAAMNLDLDDLANVSESGKDEGLVLTAQADGTWAPQAMTGIIDRVQQSWGPVTSVSDVTRLIISRGLEVTPHPSIAGAAVIAPVFGASGASDTFARADHRHPPTLVGRFTFDKAGSVLSGGVNSLVDETVAGLVSSAVYDIHIIGRLEAVNSNQSGRLLVLTKIGSSGDQGLSRGFSGGVWTDVGVDGTRMSVSGVTSLRLQFWAEYSSGDPTALYSGSLVYVMTPRGGQP